MHALAIVPTAICAAAAFALAATAFDPSAFPRRSAICPAVNRATETRTDIALQYVQRNPAAARTLLMVHGWPSLWHSWVHQIAAFENDYRLLVPDLRGFGRSTHPGDVQTSGTMADLVGDLVCLMAHANVSRALCVGHDWGTQLCYQAARMRPDLFDGVIGHTIPYIPAAGPFIEAAALVPALPKLAYRVFFEQHTEDAATELDADVRRSLRATLRTVASPPPDAFLQQETTFLGGWDRVQPPPIPFLTAEEEDYWVEQYRIQGFRNTLQFYTYGNTYANWKLDTAQGNMTISVPVLSLLPKDDPVADWALAAKLLKSADYLPNLTTEILPGAHWSQLEFPEETNARMRAWLDTFYPPTSSPAGASAPAESGYEHIADEL